MGDAPDSEDAKALAAGLRRLVQAAAEVVEQDGEAAPSVRRVREHLGCELAQVLSVSTRFEVWEHVNLHLGVEAYLRAHTPEAEWFGVGGQHRGHEDIMGMLLAARHSGGYALGAADYATAAVGPEDSVEVVQVGLVPTTAPDGTPVLVGIRGPNDFGPPACRLEVLAADRAAARAVGGEVERLMREHDAFRRQVLAFGVSEHRGNELVTFLPRPALDADDVVLPDGVLDSIEQHVVGIAEHSERLLAAGQHLKRGLLLHGPPGTGKTHTVRYLMSRLRDCTVILLTGPAMRLIGQAAALARRLQPSMVVVEDVDLIALDRGFAAGPTNPLLFTLLDAMDGVGADADVTFVLTTNRADELERALADRPGRIDLAVEVPRPDADGRRRLIELYGRDVDLRADLGPVVEATEGVTASFIKELLRRAVLDAVRADGGGGVPVVGDELVDVARAMADERASLTGILLGGSDGPPRGPGGPDLPQPGLAPHITRHRYSW
ncbi:ATPase family protein associated with various cellular activities (AAA) [Saccharothrix saharensis]|uniref:ATPase family protein associated with various cellular activities (AAA) n=1 Tax=Saccharothrix saharensis TaxID=571190 RepID=A0A543JLR0_9PSEU|nr:ATP-binding protein [Saccharothrix saharensis]TQM83745.1 ATPase family protein associated with various cellular activities (AAA) [Saccharothrix saharensis]